MNRLSTALLAFALAAGGIAPVAAQPSIPPAAADTPPVSVFLITLGQGDPYWTRFGHNALRIVDRERGTDISYNWGLFDFNEPRFLTRFILGEPRYWMAGFPTWEMLEVYRAENRTIEMQELALPAAAALRLRDFVEWNALPENRGYRYDYYRDNCSTRIRDALNHALEGELQATTDTILTPHTYRWHTRRLLGDRGPAYAGIMLLLGQPTDRAITVWEEMFLPTRMRDHVRGVRVSDGLGGTMPLVAAEALIFEALRPPEPVAPPTRVIPYTLAGAVLGGLIGLLALLAVRVPVGEPRPADVRTPRRPGSAARTAAIGLATAWSTLAGIAGVAALGMWLFTEHVFTHQNENVLQVTPLSLALAVLLPLALRERATPRAARAALVLALAAAGISALGFVLQALPAMRQMNAEIIGLALPLHAGVAWAVWKLGKR